MTNAHETAGLPVEEKDGAATLAASASNAPVVPLAGVPETPLSDASPASVGAAVPSTDHYLTEASPNRETSAPAEEPPEATAAASGK